MIFLDVNDWQLNAVAADGKAIFTDTAGASTASGKLEFGQAAIQHARTHPQQFNNKYLYSLSADPIAGDLRPAKNHADLIYHHLSQLNLPADETVVLCIAGHLTNQQLGLLLGICQEAKVEVAGFIDSPLGQSLVVAKHADYHVLDIELHRMTLSHIKVTGPAREHSRTVSFDGLGVANIIEGWMNVVADEFVQKTRFDPLHAGQTEQQLYDQVSNWLSQPKLEDHRVDVVNGEASRDIEIDSKLLLDKLRQRMRSFDFSHVDSLVVTPRAAAIPGMLQLLKERVNDVSCINDVDIAHNYMTLAQGLDPKNIRRVSRAEVKTAVPTPSTATSNKPIEPPTHLMRDNIAYPLDRAIFSRHIDPVTARTTSANVSINSDFVQGAKISLGDSIGIADEVYLAIRLE
jgi:hypothetical protein